MNIGIVGTRTRDTEEDFNLVELEFIRLAGRILDDKSCIISGGCSRGADRFAEIIAKEYEVPIIIYPADWKKNGKSAGVIRNKEIANDSDYLIACVTSDRTGGTEYTIKFFEDKVKDKTLLDQVLIIC
jgi:hypothetical protein